MAVISMTRLRVRAWRFLPAFFWTTWRSIRQVERAPGFLGGRLASQRDRAFWTLTMWTDEAALRAYRGSGAHRAAMPKLPRWCDEAAAGHWAADDPQEPPDWSAAYQRLLAAGRLTPVRHPSARQRAGEIPAPTFSARASQVLRPRPSAAAGDSRPPAGRR